MRKQLVYHNELILGAKRAKQSPPPKPSLWILSSGRPKTVIAEYGAKAMADWPKGFLQTRPIDAMYITVLNELPRTRQTLFLRLLGRGPTLRHAVVELREMPRDCLEYRLAMPILLAYAKYLPQNLLEAADMNILEKVRADYTAWEEQAQRRGMEEGKRAVVLRQLGRKFGPLSREVIERIEGADLGTLERWLDRVLSATTLDEVLKQ